LQEPHYFSTPRKEVSRGSFKNCGASSFAVPNKISDLKFINSPSSLNLEWNKPDHIYGILSHYTVELQFLRYAACQNFSGTPFESEKLTTRESKIAITGLKPYCVYSFSVSASNTYFEGTPTTQLYTTPSSEPIHEQEIPKIEGLAVNASSVQIKFIQSPCDKIRGLLWMQLQFSCQQQWCQTRTEKSLYNTTTNYTLSNLYPYSNYTLQVRFSRSTKFENTFTQTQTFQTNSSIANEVRELLVYSKNESSISLRWRDPYPPTGVLLLYNIRYFSKNSARITTNVTDAPCKLWPTHQCFTISNLKRNQSYDVEIRGFNRDTSDFGSVVRINTTTKTERSMPPYDLRVNWSFTNVLELRWKHPNETNGDINKFNIVLIPDSIHAYPFSNIVEVSKFNYSLEYHCRIDKVNILPSTKYEIIVTADNGYTGHELSIETTSPTTPTPKEERIEFELIVTAVVIVLVIVASIIHTIQRSRIKENEERGEEIPLRVN
jgi:hypothetical protein